MNADPQIKSQLILGLAVDDICEFGHRVVHSLCVVRRISMYGDLIITEVGATKSDSEHVLFHLIHICCFRLIGPHQTHQNSSLKSIVCSTPHKGEAVPDMLNFNIKFNVLPYLVSVIALAVLYLMKNMLLLPLGRKPLNPSSYKLI